MGLPVCKCARDTPTIALTRKQNVMSFFFSFAFERVSCSSVVAVSFDEEVVGNTATSGGPDVAADLANTGAAQIVAARDDRPGESPCSSPPPPPPPPIADDDVCVLTAKDVCETKDEAPLSSLKCARDNRIRVPPIDASLRANAFSSASSVLKDTNEISRLCTGE